MLMHSSNRRVPAHFIYVAAAESIQAISKLHKMNCFIAFLDSQNYFQNPRTLFDILECWSDNQTICGSITCFSGSTMIMGRFSVKWQFHINCHLKPKLPTQLTRSPCSFALLVWKNTLKYSEDVLLRQSSSTHSPNPSASVHFKFRALLLP